MQYALFVTPAIDHITINGPLNHGDRFLIEF